MHESTHPSSLVGRGTARLRAWVARHVVDDDPHPEASRLDRLDRPGGHESEQEPERGRPGRRDPGSTGDVA